jgi:hypothetical protein
MPSEARVLPELWGEFRFDAFDVSRSIEESLKETRPELE